MSHLPRAILFDLDDTLISFGRRRDHLQQVAEQFGLPAGTGDALETRFKQFWDDPVRHKAWRFRLGEARALVMEMAFRDLGLPADLARPVGERFHAWREEQAAFFPQAVETVDELKARGVKLALVTNGAGEAQRAKIERFELAHRFDHIQIEGEAGFGKPEERAYLHAMAALGVGPSDTWMVGDNLEWEVAAPQRLGIYGIWHDHLGDGLPPDTRVKPDRIIRAIPELLRPAD